MCFLKLVPGLSVVRFVVEKVLHISVWAPVRCSTVLQGVLLTDESGTRGHLLACASSSCLPRVEYTSKARASVGKAPFAAAFVSAAPVRREERRTG